MITLIRTISIVFALTNLVLAEEVPVGLLFYCEPPSTYVEVIKFSRFQKEPVISTVILTTKGTRQVRNNAILARIDYPPFDSGAVSEERAKLMVALTQETAAKYPQYSATLSDVKGRWESVLIRSAKLRSSQRASNGATVTFKGSRYDEVALTSVANGVATIMHSGGVARILVAELTPLDIVALNATSTTAQIGPTQSQPTTMEGGNASVSAKAPLSVLFGVRVSPASVDDMLRRSGYAPVESRPNNPSNLSSFRNEKLDAQIVVIGKDEVYSISMGLQLGKRKPDEAAEALAQFRDVADFVVPGSGTWFMHFARGQLIDATEARPNGSKLFGTHQVEFDFTASDQAGKFSGVTLRLTRDAAGHSISGPQATLDSLVLQPAVLEKVPNRKRDRSYKDPLQPYLQNIKLSVARGGEDPETERSDNSIRYYSADGLQIQLKSEVKKQFYQGPIFSDPGKFVSQWVAKENTIINLRIRELPILLSALEKYEQLRLSVANGQLAQQLMKPIGSLYSDGEISFSSPDRLRIGGTTNLDWYDVLVIKRLLSLLPELKAKVYTTVEGDVNGIEPAAPK